LATRKLQRHSKLSLGSFVPGGIPDQSFCRQGCEEPCERADKNRRAKPGGDAGQPAKCHREQQRRLWHSWDDYHREWCRYPDFCYMLPQLLEGEDPDFVAWIQRIAGEEGGCVPAA
jgi:hypothetical protein